MVPGTLILLFTLLCTFIQIYFFAIYFQKISQIKTQERNSGFQPPVSVVICARNEAGNLERYLPPILNQEYPAFEVIVVDHLSTDESLSILKRLGQEYKNLEYLTCTDPQSSKKPALRMGIQKSRYNHLLVTDADCWPESRFWISRMMEPFSRGAEIVLGAAPLMNGHSLLASFTKIEAALVYLQYATATLRGNSYMGVGRNMAYIKDLYLAHDHLQHPQYIGGDDDLFVSEFSTTKVEIVGHEDALMFSMTPRSWSSYYHAKRRHVVVSWSYTWRQKINLLAFAGTHWCFFAGLFSMLLTGHTPLLTLSLFALRSLFVYKTLTSYTRSFLRNQSKFYALFIETFYLVHYPVIALFLFVKPPIRW